MLDSSGDCLCGISIFLHQPTRRGVLSETPAGKKSYRRADTLNSRVLARGEYPLLARNLGGGLNLAWAAKVFSIGANRSSKRSTGFPWYPKAAGQP